MYVFEWILNLILCYSCEVVDGEFFIYVDVFYCSEINYFLYELVEFEGKLLIEVGLCVGYVWVEGDYEYEVLVFVCNMFDE